MLKRLSVEHRRTCLTLLFHENQIDCSKSNTCHVPLLWDRSLLLSSPRLFALSGYMPYTIQKADRDRNKALMQVQQDATLPRLP